QFILIRRDIYEAMGGHARVANEVLEDVAIARLVKRAGYPIWFGSGRGIVRVRMYRCFASMWEGWKKNLCQLMGESRKAVYSEIARATLPLFAVLIAAISVEALTDSPAASLGTLVVGFLILSAIYAGELRRSQFPGKLAFWGIPGRLLFVAVLWASYRSHIRGRLEWKG